MIVRHFAWLLAAPLLIAADLPESKPTPLGNPGEWVTPDDYPSTALRAMREGITSFVLDIDERGAVTQCAITGSSGTGELDAATCVLLRQRARFAPARDARGHPVPSTYRNRIRWQIPRDAVVPLESTDKMLEFDIDRAGAVTNCRATDALNDLNLTGAMCEEAAIGALNGVKPDRPIHVIMRQSMEITDLPEK